MPALAFELAPALLFSLTLLLVMLDLLYQATTPIHGVKPLVVTGPTWGDIIKAIEGPLSAARGWVDGSIWNVIRAVWAWQNSHVQFLNAIGVHVESTHNALSSITYTRIPAARAAAHTEAQQVYHDSLDYAGQVDADATRKANQAQINSVNFARAAAAAVDAHAVQLTGQAEQYAGQLSAQDQAFTRAVGAAADAYAKALSDEGLAFTQQAVGDAEKFAAQVGADANAYTDAVAHTLINALQQAEQAGYSYTGAAVSSQVVPLTASLAQVTEAVRELEQSDCMKFCNPLGGLGAALEGIDLALILGMVATALADPDGVRAVLEDVAGDVEKVADEGLGLLRSA